MSRWVPAAGAGFGGKVFATHAQIDMMVRLARLVMVNAIYFKGEWKFPFNKEDTETMKFNVDSARQVGSLKAWIRLI